MSGNQKNRIFILGCERSGSTWLANIFDALPDSVLYMEPFAPFAGLFPDVPDRNTYANPDTESLEISVREGYQRLYKAKYPLFYKPNRSIYLKRVDQILVRTYIRVTTSLGLPVGSVTDQYRLLNLNASKIPIRRQVKKHVKCGRPVEVTKELRLNFKVRLLASVFPDARYIVMLRDPGAQIASIERLLQRGGLDELKGSLSSFGEKVRTCDRFSNYWDAMDLTDWEHDRQAMLALWWVINYQVLLDDLQLHGLDYCVIYHEEICQNPEIVVDQMLGFCGLAVDPNVQAYLNYSTQNENGDLSPLNTTRKSREYSMRCILSVDHGLREKIASVISKIRTRKELRDYGRVD